MGKTNVSIGSMVHSFAEYPVGHFRRSGFKRDNWLITAMNAGYIVPIWYDEAVPGDTLKMNIRTLSRLATQIVPFMYNVYMDIHVWCVPHRLLWKNWVRMHGEQPNPGDSIDFLTPQLTTANATDCPVGSLYDYFGIVPGVANVTFNVFNFRAYNMVWNEFYRDENLQDRVPFTDEDSGDEFTDYVLLKRGKRKDYFTSCLPSPQKGQQVDLPLGQSADITFSNTNVSVYGDGKPLGLYNGQNFRILAMAPYDSSTTNGYIGLTTGSSITDNVPGTLLNTYQTSNGNTSQASAVGVTTSPSASGLVGKITGNGTVDLSSATAVTINSLYQAFAVQNLLVRDNRGGTRYIESILAHFGVRSSDMRMQRPEFLGGGTFDLNLSVVPQTSATDTTSPQGNLSSYGVIAGRTKNIIKSFEEFCVVFAVASIRAPYTYQHGLDKIYSRHSRFDYYYPELDNLGEQAVLNKEIYVSGNSNTDNGVFGYQERWAEMRTKLNRITGVMRSKAGLSLDVWHLAEDFNSTPLLNDEFIQENPPIDRVIAVAEGSQTPQFICNFAFDETWYRPMGLYSVPGLQGLGVM